MIRSALFFLAGASSILCAGDIAYAIHEFPKGKPSIEICSTSFIQKSNIVQNQTTPESDQLSMYIPLCKGFGLSVVYSQEQNLDGFALCAENQEDDFSWEWFNKNKEGIFEKLQEGGQIRVDFASITMKPTITTITFLTNISLRLKKSGEDDHRTYRINIKKGSKIDLL